jgi:hypothetical protein
LPGLVGRDPKDAFDKFRDHLGWLLNKTITDARLSLIHVKNEDKAQVSFRQNSIPIAASVFANDLFLYIGQTLRVTQQADKTWKLRTVEYRYRIQGSPGLEDEDCLRWEYVAREIRDTGHCRHHLHLQGEYTLGPRRTIPLARVHLPTGWVTIEEVIRFLITELDVRPKEREWENLLRQSEESFKQWTGRDA